MKSEDVRRLNERIEKINTAKTKAEAQADMLKKRLSSEIKEYEKVYGVKLMGKNMAETQKRIEEEGAKVEKNLNEEYKLKEAIVTAVEKGDYDEVNRLLGKPQEVAQEVEDIDFGTEESLEGMREAEAEYSGGGNDEGSENTPEGIEEVIEAEEAEEDFGFDLGDEVEEEAEEDFGFDLGSEVEEVEEKKAIPEGMLDFESAMNMSVEEDEEDDFGFGELLSGTKFE